MKKKALLLASMGVLACTVGVTALAVSGTGKFGNVRVHAEIDPDTIPGEYSITFNADNTLTGMVNDSYILFLTTTERGATVGVSGQDNGGGGITFANRTVGEIHFYNDGYHLADFDFDHFTGVKVVFEGFVGSDDFLFTSGNGEAVSLESGVRVSRECTPADYPRITAWDEVDITSITIYYTC